MVKWAMLRVWFNSKWVPECSNKHNFWNLHEKTILETYFQKRNLCETCMEYKWNMMNLLTFLIFSSRYDETELLYTLYINKLWVI